MGDRPREPRTLREKATRAVVENLGLIWPDEAEPMHEEIADAVLAVAADAAKALPRYQVPPHTVGIIVQREIRNTVDHEPVVRAQHLDRLLEHGSHRA